jgi:branched-chain amino acid transport system ATP-binding protein
MGLEVSEVSVSFGGLEALSEVSLKAELGSITGLIGPNGAGKTTLFNVVMGMQPSTSGAIRLEGRDLRGIAPYRRARLGLGRTFQRLELFGTLTVLENIKVAASIVRRSVFGSNGESPSATAERLIGLLHLEPVANVRADMLPTGTGRLVELARALAVKPTVVLLDEPASGQSEEETAQFASILRTLAAHGLGILLVEHDMNLIMSVTDHLVVLDHGRVLSEGEPAVVQADPAVQKAYLGTMRDVASG